MTAKDRRKKIRIVHQLQVKHTVKFFLLFFIILLLIGFQMVYIVKLLLPHTEFLVIRNEIIKTLVLIMIEVVITLGILAIYNIIYLHRFVGPINRLIREIEEMVKTKEYHTLQVRKDDELLPLISKFNLIIEELIRKK